MNEGLFCGLPAKGLEWKPSVHYSVFLAFTLDALVQSIDAHSRYVPVFNLQPALDAWVAVRQRGHMDCYA